MKKIFLLFFLVGIAVAVDFPQKRGAVNDFAGVIPLESAQQIEALAIEVFNKTGVAIVVCTMPSIGDADYQQYANELYSYWGIGVKGQDRGVLILNVVDIRKLKIETGYGVEGFIPDAVAGDIIRQHLAPHLRAGDYGGGFLAAAQAIAGLAGKEYNVSFDGSIETRPSSRQSTKSSPLRTMLIIIAILVMMISGRRGGGLPWLILGSLLGSSGGGRDDHGGGFGGGSWGGGFGGGGGGGFGGFGGGSSGGGGAGGSY
jgi:uncharacterized protein